MIDMSEYRAWISIERLPATDEAAWEPLINALEQRHREFGPVIGWKDENTAQIVLSCEAGDEASAGERLVDAVFDGLRVAGLTSHYPSALEVAPATEDESARSAA